MPRPRPRRGGGAVPLFVNALAPATVPLTPRPRRRPSSPPSADEQMVKLMTYTPPLYPPAAVPASTLVERERAARRVAAPYNALGARYTGL